MGIDWTIIAGACAVIATVLTVALTDDTATPEIPRRDVA